MKEKKRIAIFQANWGIQLQTVNFLKMFVKEGFSVDFFLLECSEKFDSLDQLQCNTYRFSLETRPWKEYKKKIRQIVVAFNYFILDPLLGEKKIIPAKIIKESLNIINKNEYKCIIGIEKAGLIWAGILAQESGIPLIYYSLELLSNNWIKQMRLLKSFRYLKIRRIEKKYHKKAVATIIQDDLRAKEIIRYNKIKRTDKIFLPVSTLGKPIMHKSNYLREMLNIDRNKKIILQFGLIDNYRLSDKIAMAAQSFPEEFVLVFHGTVLKPGILEKIKKIDVNKRIIISSHLAPPEDIDNLISSADIGLCFYNNKTRNDLLAGFSSEKLARYLRCGVPTVAFDYLSFYNSIEKNKCGICISSLSDLTRAINKIFSQYDFYRNNSFKTYLQHFEFSSQFTKVINYINDV